MEIILVKDVEKLGFANDIVSVAPGYANNYLIPQGFARAATASAKKVLAENIRQQSHKEAKLVADAEALAEKIAALSLRIEVKAEEGKIFGSVTGADLAEAMKGRGVEVDRKNIVVDGVKTVGEYEATVKLYKQVRATVKFSVVAAE
ncbi:MAG: 50S ribosomal protein L9 [Rikenellaceae bacterium]|jgi:large subunit ribosomal protein L9|nr:50S ribosomal protein L9 [Rikenellaceae bacterium]